MLSSYDSAKQPFVRTDTISPLTRADSDANRFNTFSPRASGDTSFIKHLLINTGDEITPNPCMTPGSQQGNLTMRSNLVSSLGGSLTSSPQVTPLAVAHPRFQTWVTPDKDATPQPSPQPSPKPDNATDRTQRLAITRAKTIGLLTPPASARKPRLDRIKTGQVYRIDEGNNNSPESSAKTPKK
jgi:predicted component of type VI protein secretion system